MIYVSKQQVLDAICNPVGGKITPMYVGWSVGQWDAVSTAVAELFGTNKHEVDNVISRLVNDGLLTDKPDIPHSFSPAIGTHLGITHEGWQRWSYFNEHEYFDLWNFDSLEEWLDAERVPEDNLPVREVFALTPVQPSKKPQHQSIDEPWYPSMDE